MAAVQPPSGPPPRVHHHEEPLPGAPAPRTHPFIANPVPVGVAGFALTTFTLGLYTSGQFNAAGEPIVFGLAAFYGGLTQFIAGFFALGKGELFPAAFMTTYGAFWFTFVALNLYLVPVLGVDQQGVQIYLIMWTVITAIFTLATLGTNWTVFAAFIAFMVALILLDIGWGGTLNSAGTNGTIKAAGYAEMVLAAIAWYIVAAEVINETLQRTILPLFPFRHMQQATLAE